jgi:DNA-binding NtrC family response regulator
VYQWPGNVRELKNVMERAKLIGGGNTIQPEDLPAEMSDVDRAPVLETGEAVAIPSARLDEMEKQQILAILNQVRWNRGRAAELLGISPKTLYRKLRSYGIQ